MAVEVARRVVQEDLRSVAFETSEDVDVTSSFDKMGLREGLLRGIYAYGMPCCVLFCLMDCSVCKLNFNGGYFIW